MKVRFGILPKQIEDRMNPKARHLHNIRESAYLPKFLNQAEGKRTSNAMHIRTHEYFERLSPEFERSEQERLSKNVVQKLKVMIGVSEICFGVGVSSIFADIFSRIKPTRLIATTHEYPGLVESARTGQINDNLITWQMYGLVGRKLATSNTRLSVDLIEPYHVDALVGSAARERGSSIILVSHVSRVDGRIFPIAEIDQEVQKLNRERLAGDKIHFIVDGSQAVGSMEVDLSKFSGTYLFTSSKALMAEPCIGVAVGNEPIGIDSWISLPELFSLDQILETVDFLKFYDEFKRMKKEALRIFGTLDGVNIVKENLSSPYMVYFSIPGVNPVVIREGAAREGFDIYGEEQKYVYTKPEYARISFTSETNWNHIEEFARFLSVFVSRIKKQGGEF